MNHRSLEATPEASHLAARSRLLSSMLWLALYGSALAAVLTATRAFDRTTTLAGAAACVVMLVTSGAVWHLRRRDALAPPVRRAVGRQAGVAAGILWVVEISINNMVTPPNPLRDRIDNSFWAAVALIILGASIGAAYTGRRLLDGVRAGAWSGFVSGLIACCTGLTVIVFGMPLLLHDPLNVAEWAARGATSGAPSMAAYVAFESLAGALGHLTVLGIVMGALLGALGGPIGRAARALVREPSADSTES